MNTDFNNNDLFFEQIVPMKITGAKLALIIVIFVSALLLCLGIIVLSMIVPMVVLIEILAIVGIIYGAYKLCQKFFIEYEYIVTNSDLDIDLIIARNTRKRLITIDLKNITALGKYNENAFANKTFSKKYFCCNKDAELMYIECKHKKQGNVLLVFSPNEKLLEAITKTVPNYAKNIWKY